MSGPASLPRARPAARTSCPCGGRYSVRIVVEYVAGGRVEYAGGRFCYVADAVIDLAIPAGATPVRALIYDLHEPDEVIRITFAPVPEQRRSPDG